MVNVACVRALLRVPLGTTSRRIRSSTPSISGTAFASMTQPDARRAREFAAVSEHAEPGDIGRSVRLPSSIAAAAPALSVVIQPIAGPNAS